MSVQDAFHHAAFDHVPGSPHIKHERLRTAIVSSLRTRVRALCDGTRRCHALELGAGHGTFTDTLVDAGASVVVTEMSSARERVLRSHFRDRPDVRVEYDDDGDWIFRTDERFDLVVCISVLHHIPDYMRAVRRLAELTRPGGAFVCWQDPTWYPSMPTSVRAMSTGSYFVWRIGRGNLRRGLATRLRRGRGVLDENRAEDSAEYHVVRQGVDQDALVRLLAARYASVDLQSYWSTQWGPLHRVGQRMGLGNTFAIEATGRIGHDVGAGAGRWSGVE
ncbi:MAG: class I SAM-dependent methyltransferase [Acidimicrobiales bacterium]|nr:class I SAM-dependent methyltransferase [Acidimicrobiales bacterium]